MKARKRRVYATKLQGRNHLFKNKACYLTSTYRYSLDKFIFTSVSVGSNFILVEVLKMEYSLIGFVEAAAAIGMLLMSIYFASRSNVKYPLQFSKRTILGLSVLVGTLSIPLIFNFSGTLLFVYFLANMFFSAALAF